MVSVALVKENDCNGIGDVCCIDLCVRMLVMCVCASDYGVAWHGDGCFEQ